VAYETVCRPVQPSRNSRIESHLSHEDKQRNDRESVIGERVEVALGEHAHTRLEVDHEAETYKADEHHCEGKLDPKGE
jgi:hypothetical protein